MFHCWRFCFLTFVASAQELKHSQRENKHIPHQHVFSHYVSRGSTAHKRRHVATPGPLLKDGATSNSASTNKRHTTQACQSAAEKVMQSHTFFHRSTGPSDLIDDTALRHASAQHAQRLPGPAVLAGSRPRPSDRGRWSTRHRSEPRTNQFQIEASRL